MKFEAVARELPAVWRLAWPVATAEVAWTAMAVVDTLIAGRVSAEALGAVGIGSTVFFTVALFCMGLLFGLDFEVSRAVGLGDDAAARRWFGQGVWLALAIAVPATVLVRWGAPQLAAAGVRPEVMRELVPFLRTLSWGFVPLLLMTAMRRYLQATGRVRPVMLAVVSANLVNAVVGYVLVFGLGGFEGMGTPGIAWATNSARVYMAAVLAWTVGREAWRIGVPRGTEFVALVRLGGPASLQLAFECGVFATVSTLAGRLAPESLAAHQIVLNIASLTFMVPLGISVAGSVRVGHALGEGRRQSAQAAGWAALAMAGGFMIVSGVVLVSTGTWLIGLYTADASVVAVGLTLLRVAAVFQLFDGLQVAATGVLRGTGETRLPALANLVGHWVFGLPTGAALCFWYGWDVAGLWTGLCIGLVIVAAVLLRAWARRGDRGEIAVISRRSQPES